MRDSTIFYRSFYEAVQELPLENQAVIYNAIFEYSLNGILADLSGINLAIFTLIKPQLDANHKRYENGNKPKKSKTEAKPKQKTSESEANKNVNDNNNVNKNKNKNHNENKNDNSFVPNGTYQIFIDEYSLFFEKANSVKPKINGTDGKAAKELIQYLTTVSIEKNEQGAINTFKYILKNWHKLDSFLAGQIKLIQINANINNIINQLKNGNAKQSVTDKGRSELEKVLAGIAAE